ncbi:unnamed protein product [Phytophthora fragariaefolia]|uniref:Unnamed protein product n=1 Tax=Phytophthora fragariaefolia TaxID=1490495 RepID=A0A9W6XZD5_9STRA|nr:unnamed protein product [Phytophthora fragariaefolia]
MFSTRCATCMHVCMYFYVSKYVLSETPGDGWGIVKSPGLERQPSPGDACYGVFNPPPTLARAHQRLPIGHTTRHQSTLWLSSASLSSESFLEGWHPKPEERAWLELKSNRCCAVCCQAGMARTKRKWTREAIEEALLQNTCVNATPAEPEDAAAKRKRQQRRSNKKRNLIKELNALSVTGAESAAPQAVPVIQVQPMLQAQTTLEQEGKQEEDDPANHQRQFAAAYAEGQREAASEAEPQVTRLSSADRSAAKRARNAEQQRARRANMTASQTERRRAKDRAKSQKRSINGIATGYHEGG